MHQVRSLTHNTPTPSLSRPTPTPTSRCSRPTSRCFGSWRCGTIPFFVLSAFFWRTTPAEVPPESFERSVGDIGSGVRLCMLRGRTPIVMGPVWVSASAEDRTMRSTERRTQCRVYWCLMSCKNIHTHTHIPYWSRNNPTYERHLVVKATVVMLICCVLHPFNGLLPSERMHA